MAVDAYRRRASYHVDKDNFSKIALAMFASISKNYYITLSFLRNSNELARSP